MSKNNDDHITANEKAGTYNAILNWLSRVYGEELFGMNPNGTKECERILIEVGNKETIQSVIDKLQVIVSSISSK